jgi:hypothetical protein
MVYMNPGGVLELPESEELLTPLADLGYGTKPEARPIVEGRDLRNVFV